MNLNTKRLIFGTQSKTLKDAAPNSVHSNVRAVKGRPKF